MILIFFFYSTVRLISRFSKYPNIFLLMFLHSVLPFILFTSFCSPRGRGTHIKLVSVGAIYRSPNSDQLDLNVIENSTDLAISTRMSDIIFSADFIFGMLKGTSASKMKINNTCK